LRIIGRDAERTVQEQRSDRLDVEFAVEVDQAGFGPDAATQQRFDPGLERAQCIRGVDVADDLGVASVALRKTAAMEQKDVGMGMRALHAEQVSATIEIEVEPPHPAYRAPLAARSDAHDVRGVAQIGRRLVVIRVRDRRHGKRDHAAYQGCEPLHEVAPIARVGSPD
jgi:hypothetical protein